MVQMGEGCRTLSTETTILHGVIDQLKQASEALWKLGLVDEEYAVNDALDMVQEALEDAKDVQ